MNAKRIAELEIAISLAIEASLEEGYLVRNNLWGDEKPLNANAGHACVCMLGAVANLGSEGRGRSTACRKLGISAEQGESIEHGFEGWGGLVPALKPTEYKALYSLGQRLRTKYVDIDGVVE